MRLIHFFSTLARLDKWRWTRFGREREEFHEQNWSHQIPDAFEADRLEPSEIRALFGGRMRGTFQQAAEVDTHISHVAGNVPRHGTGIGKNAIQAAIEQLPSVSQGCQGQEIRKIFWTIFFSFWREIYLTIINLCCFDWRIPARRTWPHWSSNTKRCRQRRSRNTTTRPSGIKKNSTKRSTNSSECRKEFTNDCLGNKTHF